MTTISLLVSFLAEILRRQGWCIVVNDLLARFTMAHENCG